MKKLLVKLQARSPQPLSPREINWIWISLAGSTVVFFQAHIGPAKFGINLSPFDLLVPAIGGWCLLMRRIELPPRSVWVIAAFLQMFLVAHAALSFRILDRLSPLHLAHGSVKFMAFIVLTTLLIELFRDGRLRYPPFPATAALFAGVTIYLVVVKIVLVRAGGGSFVPSTNFLSGLVGTLFLLIVGAYHEGGNTKRVLVAVAAIAATCISIYSSTRDSNWSRLVFSL